MSDMGPFHAYNNFPHLNYEHIKGLDFALDPNSIPIHLFEYLLSAHYVLDTVLGSLLIRCVFLLLELYTVDTLFTDHLANKGQSPNAHSVLLHRLCSSILFPLCIEIG